MTFAGKVAVVTGAGRGIGQAVALGYAKAGAQVVVVEKDESLAKETAQKIRGTGGECLAVVADVAKPDQVTSSIDQAHAWRGRLDVLINNAGISRWKSPLELTVDEWDEVINTNLRSAFLCSREAATYMKEAGGGAIVNLASTRALMSEPNTEAYAASKGGIVALTHALAVSFGPLRITVNAISPGWIETGDYDALRPIDHEQHPSGRVGRPEDIARACLYLTAPENNFVTGINLVVDGGMTRKMIYEED